MNVLQPRMSFPGRLVNAESEVPVCFQSSSNLLHLACPGVVNEDKGSLGLNND